MSMGIKKKKIWIVALSAEIESLNLRYRSKYLANLLNENGYDVTMFSSDFSHRKKAHVCYEVEKSYSFKVILVHESGYKKHVSLCRVKSHLEFAINFKKIAKKMEIPDLIYAKYPTMAASYVAGKFAKKHNIPFILDVQDNWPEAISAAININKLHTKVLMYPFTLFANKIYKMADFIFGQSETCVNRAKLKSSRSKGFVPIYLGSDLSTFNDFNKKKLLINKKDNEIWLTYIGTLSHSYDVETAIRALSSLRKVENLKLQILGTGPDKDKLIKLAEDLELLDKNVFFHGLVEFEIMVEYLKKSDIALNALTATSKGNITNKFGDYVAAGLPMLNSCQEKEVLDLVVEKELGLNYQPGDVESLENAIMFILSDKEKLKEYSANAIRFAEEKFDRKNSYKVFLSKIGELLNGF